VDFFIDLYEKNSDLNFTDLLNIFLFEYSKNEIKDSNLKNIFIDNLKC